MNKPTNSSWRHKLNKMAKSKKFKPVLKASEIRCGVTYLRVFVNDEGLVFCNIYTPTHDPYVAPANWEKNGKALMVDYITITIAGDAYHFKDKFVSDLIGIYDDKRQTSTFSDILAGTKTVLYSKGLFKFSNKLLEKIKSFKGDPIKVFEFLNPEKFLTASERSIVLSALTRKPHRNVKQYLIEIKNEYYKL